MATLGLALGELNSNFVTLSLSSVGANKRSAQSQLAIESNMLGWALNCYMDECLKYQLFVRCLSLKSLSTCSC